MMTFPITYYKFKLTAVSPLSIGSGENVYTDHDVMTDSLGKPFIPATALAGVMRSFLGEQRGRGLFGDIQRKEKTPQGKTIVHPAVDSQIRVYDATCTKKEDVFFGVRDSVKLKQKLAQEGAKFDMQIVEPGVSFQGYLELLDQNFETDAESFFCAMNTGEVLLGTKTSRGYGQVKVQVYKKQIADAQAYLDYALLEDSTWVGVDAMDLTKVAYQSNRLSLDVQLKLTGAVSIREYSTDVGMPDYRTLSLKAGKEPVPVIPGTSWAGAFRARFTELTSEKDAGELFGDVYKIKQGNQKVTVAKKSKIHFGESKLSGGAYKDITRNSIDRFSAATKDGALYTERTYYYGKTTLKITLDSDVSDKALEALAVCLWDLHHGFLAVGGLTAVGRGLFEIESIGGDSTQSACVTGTSPLTGDFVKLVKGE